jgi:hypothetical protein
VSLFFSNPELIRNARIQLRPGRMIAAAVICAVISATLWASIVHSSDDPDFAGLHKGGAVFLLILNAQIAILLIGGGIYCLQSVHREKELNTFDYQRVTRLTSLELAVGKLFGAPIAAYFVVLCLMPVAVIGAVKGSVPTTRLLGAYVILLIGSIAYHALALLVSTLMKRTGGFVSSIFLFLILVWISSVDLYQNSTPWSEPTLDLHAVSPFFAGRLVERAGPVIEGASQSLGSSIVWTDKFFGKSLPHLAVLMALYVIFTAWFLLGITRNLKRDPSLYEVYSPNQATAFVLYLNLLVLGFFPWTEKFNAKDFYIGNKPYHVPGAFPGAVEQSLLFASLWLFAILALILLRSRERTRIRIRQIGSGAARFLAALWPTPYLIGGIAVTGGAIVGLISHYRGSGEWDIKMAIYEAAFLAIWLSRDALYLQWMNVRRAKRPLAVAFLYLIVFYGSTGIIFGSLSLYNNARSAAATAFLVPSPLFALGHYFWYQQTRLWLLALAAQGAEAVVFWQLHRMRLRELDPAASSSPETMPAGDLPQHA